MVYPETTYEERRAMQQRAQGARQKREARRGVVCVRAARVSRQGSGEKQAAKGVKRQLLLALLAREQVCARRVRVFACAARKAARRRRRAQRVRAQQVARAQGSGKECPPRARGAPRARVAAPFAQCVVKRMLCACVRVLRFCCCAVFRVRGVRARRTRSGSARMAFYGRWLSPP